MATAEQRLYSAGIRISLLLSSDLSVSELRVELEDLRLTNGIVLDLHYIMNKTSNCTYHTFKNWIAAILGSKWPVHNPLTGKALRQSVTRLSSRLSKLQKERNTEKKEAAIASFREDDYCLPNLFISHGKCKKNKFFS
jgi:hypothetical protein